MSALAPPLGPLIGPADDVYLSFEETPHDVLPPGYEDGDNGALAGKHMDARLRAELSRPKTAERQLPDWLAAQGRKVIVPHPRDLKRGDAGADVLALQRALAADHLRRWGNFTRADGAGVVAEVNKLKEAHGLKVNGVYDEAAHRALAPFYDPYGIFLLLGYQASSAIARARAAALSACMIAYDYRATIHYTEGSLRWMMIANHVRATAIPTWRALWADCSSWYTWIFWDLGLPDPNLLDYTGGFTGTLGAHGVHVAPGRAQVGAGFLYGDGAPWKHIQFGVGGENTIGNGGEAGPLYLPAGYRGDLSVVKAYPGLP